MSANQRARSGVPLDKQSIVATVAGLPWWGVVSLGAGMTTFGFVLDAARGSELTALFSTMYFLGCVFAAAAASNRALFTAMVQPPLILFVGVPLAQSLIGDGFGSGIKDIAINVAYPLVNRFPVMLGATVVALAVCGARLFLLQQRRNGPARSSDRRRSARADRTEKVGAASRRPRRSARSEEGAPPRPSRSPRAASSRTGTRRPAPEESAPRPRRRTAPPDDLPPRSRRATQPPQRGSASGRPFADRSAGSPPPSATRAPREAVQQPRQRPRSVSEVPAHPIPQVRYRDRYEPPFESERP